MRLAHFAAHVGEAAFQEALDAHLIRKLPHGRFQGNLGLKTLKRSLKHLPSTHDNPLLLHHSSRTHLYMLYMLYSLLVLILARIRDTLCGMRSRTCSRAMDVAAASRTWLLPSRRQSASWAAAAAAAGPMRPRLIAAQRRTTWSPSLRLCVSAGLRSGMRRICRLMRSYI